MTVDDKKGEKIKDASSDSLDTKEEDSGTGLKSNGTVTDTVVVGIGASAGGLEALEQFFQSMPSDSGLAFVIISHLDPEHRSMLGEIISRYTKMNVLTIKEGMSVQPDKVYVIPSEEYARIDDNTLHLVSRTDLRTKKMPVDLFFRSLAAAKEENAIAVVLSGTGTDGSLGIKDVKEHLGLVIAQDLISAKFDGMPRSTIETGLADYVLSPSEIPSQLIRYIGHRTAGLEAEKDEQEVRSEAIYRILAIVRAQTGNDFSNYKKKTIIRRVERRMDILGLKDLPAYTDYLRKNPGEVGLMQKDLIISVTRFFRDPEAFVILKEKIMTDLFPQIKGSPVLRVWVPACATGEEVYSIAIVLQECMDEVHLKFDIQIFGTDIDAEAIEKARAGRYSDNISSDVGAERLSKFFVFEKDRYRVKKSIREMAVFATHNLLKDPPFSRIDIISCRNLLIYLEPNAQARVASTLAYVANPGALLFLGASESLSPFSEFFRPLSDKVRIAERMKYPVPTAMSTVALSRVPEETGGLRSMRTTDGVNGLDWKGVVPEIERFLLDRLNPPTVIINSSGDVIYIHGDTGKYLQPAIGKATNKISSMARKGLKSYLSSGILRASKEGKEILIKNIKLDVYGHPEMVDLKVIPIIGLEGTEGLLAVVFEGSHPIKIRKNVEQHRVAQECEVLKEKLDETEKQLNAVTFELESSHEENKSLNEEMESTSEEFQSTTEELETSREELQSVNEELLTVNNELQQRMEKLADVNNDMKNLLNNTDIAIIFLDIGLKLRRFTEPVTKFVDLVQEDIGRPLAAFSTNLDEVDLTAKAQSIIDTLKPEEKEVHTKNGEWYLMRLLPYRTEGNTPDGVVITFVNINSRKLAEKEVFEAAEEAEKKAERLEAMLRSLSEGLIELDMKGRVIYANSTALDQLSVESIDEFAQRFELRTKDGEKMPLEDLPQQKAIREGAFSDEEYQVRKSGTQFAFRGIFNGTPVRDRKGRVTSIVITIRETTGHGRHDNQGIILPSDDPKKKAPSTQRHQ